MNPIELRIGNWVKDNQFAHYKVIGLTKKRIKVERNGLKFNLLCDSFLQPIPLSEQWLYMWNFKKIPIGYELIIDKRKIIIRMDLHHVIEKKTTHQLLFDDGFDVHMVRFYIDYVHQIENLFFALTG